MDKKLNFVFFGTPNVASETLEMLKEAGFLPSLIVTSPDKPQGRKMLITSTPVKNWAKKNNIPYIQPEKLTPEMIREKVDLFIVVAYGKIMPKNVLQIPKYGSLNIHYSLLPKYRGASPVEAAILNGDTITGVAIQKMQYKLDSGPIIAMEKVIILPNEKSEELRPRLIRIGGELLVKTLQKPLPDGENQDDSKATYCQKIKKEDGLVDLASDPVKNYNKFRAYAAWPRTFFFQNNKRIIITDAALENGKFIIKKVLPEGKKEIKYEDFLKTSI